MSYWDNRYIQGIHPQWKANGELVKNEIKELINSGNSCLDYGCGEGSFYKFLSNLYINYTGFDISNVAINLAMNSYGNNFTNEFNDKKRYDLVFCCFVLQHIISDDELLEKLKQFRLMLNRNGSLFVIDNISHKDNLGYMIFRSEGEHEALFEMACFEMIESKKIKIDNEDVKIWRLV